MDIDKGLYRVKELTEGHVSILKSVGYMLIRQTISQGAGEYWLIRLDVPQYQESLEHQFFVKYTEQLVRRYTDNVELFRTRKPDIVFEDRFGKKIAIEIETGKTLTNRGKLEEKAALLKNTYGNNYFFLVIDRLKRKQYAYYGDAITRTGLASKIRGYF